MKVLLLPGDQEGCGYYRMRLPSRYAGADCTWADTLELATRNGSMRVDAEDADVVVFQRPMDVRLVAAISALQKQGIACVVEIDDDLANLDSAHQAWRWMHPRYNRAANWLHLKRACQLADLVTVTTPALARRYAGHGRFAIIPNYIESRLLNWRREPSWDFGWSGALASHPRDLQVMGTAVRSLVDEGFTFRVVGEAGGGGKVLGLDTDPPFTGWLELGAYYAALAEFRVGMVPLALTAFNKAKSWLKGMEYAALGIPFVASRTPEYDELAALGAGYLAAKPKQWRAYLRLLIKSPEARAEAAGQGRAAVRQHLTIEANGWRWAEAWHSALVHRRA